MLDEVLNASEGQPTLNRDQLMELVADGQRALGQGRADEALMVADSVIESDDKLPAAWALKGDALERQNRLQEALACYERVIDLKPDSTLDRIRANHLRKLATVDELEVTTAPPNRRQAALAAVAASVFFILVGTAVVLASQPQSNAASNLNQPENTSVEPNNVQPTFSTVPPVPGGDTLPGGANSGTDTLDPDAGIRPGYVRPYNYPGPVDGKVDGDGGQGPLIDPVTPHIGGGTATPNNDQGGTTGGGTFNPPTRDDNPPPDPVDSRDTPKNNGGTIIITPSNTGGGGTGTVPPTNDADAQMSADALVQVARDHYVRGDYAKAAAAYEKALRAGAQPSSTNHRLGLCYKNLGRKAEAIAALDRAIKAYQAEIDNGANPEIPKSGIDACQQALKILRGG
jgi:Tfp pilus assembly protein PilF